MATPNKSTSVQARKLYVITYGDDNDALSKIIVISGPETPTLQAMMAQYDEVFGWPSFSVHNFSMEVYNQWQADFDAARARQRAAGFDYYALAFVDWLLKTDSRFQREPYAEVNL